MELVQRLNQAASLHQTVYPEDRMRKSLFEEAASELAQLRADNERLRAVKITVDTPNDVCDGIVHDTIQNIERQYGAEALNWVCDLKQELDHKDTTTKRYRDECNSLRAANAEWERKHGLLLTEVKAWRTWYECPIHLMRTNTAEQRNDARAATDAGGAMEVGE